MLNLLLKISNIYDITPNNTPYNILDKYNEWINMYSLFITLGIICSIIACYYCFKSKNIPTDSLNFSIIFIIPISLLGSSFFGKYNHDINHPWSSDIYAIKFWSLFAFWKPGMSIHGGILFGFICGYIIFHIIAKQTKISKWVYLDCILPNILLGQIIGRWGNFFNHELLGQEVTYESLKWLPSFIQDNCWQWEGNFPEIRNNEIIWRNPIFLYESFWNFILWLILMIIIPKLNKIFNFKYLIHKNNIYQLKINWKFFFQYFILHKNIEKKNYMFKKIYIKNINKHMPSQKKIDIILNKLNHRPKAINIKEKIKYWWQCESYYITKLNNPYKKYIIRSGFLSGIYLFGWNIIRFIFELQREQDTSLFIMNNRIIDYITILLISIFGLLLSIFAQWYAPNKTRKNGYIYEQEYINFHIINSWKLEQYLYNNLIIGKDNFANNLAHIIKKYTTKYLEYKNKDFDKYFILQNIHFKTHHLSEELDYFSFEITSNNQQNKFFGKIKIIINIRLDLKYFFKKQKILLYKTKKTNYLNLSKNKITNLLNNIINHNIKKIKILNMWQKKFKNINLKYSTILFVNINNLINLKTIKIFYTTKKIKFLKYKFNSIKFYFFSKDIILKIIWK